MNEAGDSKEELSPLLAPTGFNLSEWVAGRERATRNVRVFGSFGLFAQREQAGDDLDIARATNDKARVEELQNLINDLTVRMRDDFVDFKLQALTTSRRQELAETLVAEDLEPETLSARMLAEYVVEPEGVTADDLLALVEWSEPQATKLLAAMNELNSTVPNIEGSRPF